MFFGRCPPSSVHDPIVPPPIKHTHTLGPSHFLGFLGLEKISNESEKPMVGVGGGGTLGTSMAGGELGGAGWGAGGGGWERGWGVGIGGRQRPLFVYRAG